MIPSFCRLNLSTRINLFLFSVFFFIVVVDAYDCPTGEDQYVGNAQDRFQIIDWLYRGLCVRRVQGDAQCFAVLQDVLLNLNQLRQAEYMGAASALALLPTIGALMGAPAPEIWRLFTLYPMGGILAIFLSFGGAIMPVDVEDYEQVMTRKESTFGSIVSFRAESLASYHTEKPRSNADRAKDRLDELLNKIKIRVHRNGANNQPAKHILPGAIVCMSVLLFMTQFGMAIVEQGGVIPWWCDATAWMHLWYFLVTFTTIIENYSQLPFERQYRFFISLIPYDLDIKGGDKVMENVMSDKYVRNYKDEISVSKELKQLSTLRQGEVHNNGSWGSTDSRCSVTVLVSVVDKNWKTSFYRLFSKAASISVFVTGTAIFASVVLLSLEAVVMILTLLLCGGIFGRALASGIVSIISSDEPLLHAITPPEHEALIVSGLLQENAFGSKDVQIEVEGNIFVNQRRVARRKFGWLYISFWGVLAKPYDLLKAAKRDAPKHNEYRVAKELLPPPPHVAISQYGNSGSPARQSRSPRSRLLDWEDDTRSLP